MATATTKTAVAGTAKVTVTDNNQIIAVAEETAAAATAGRLRLQRRLRQQSTES
jgi:hypothetical protein